MPATYIDRPSDKAVVEFEARSKVLRERLCQEDFLHNHGLGNEVGIYIFCYDPRLERQARRLFDRIESRFACWSRSDTRPYSLFVRNPDTLQYASR